MRDIFLIRHSITEGNQKNRYIGTTDEPLCEEGIGLLRQIRQHKKMEQVDHVFVSPLKRCKETAEILYPGIPRTVVEELRECDFGIFENKNYQELNGNEAYQKWIDSGGTLPFPGGEDPKAFRKRSVEAFWKTVRQTENEKIAFVIHGGTIMSIMEAEIQPQKSFYEWHVKNGSGYHIREEGGKLTLCERLDHNSGIS